ncbi:glycoside hydrolase domain-containing protein [Sinomonas terrae]|uniref:DUF1906 domain-containing protein n=1 Tax=Sinomonas terrae TaxID=2908838 RepID=A0ABS9U3Q6_9MICC|nr:glycoside hydrolase domain-containing protein [Sinomonas terrae]MCH6471336.1 DUF1906 domain-containing protein [Sinomonas terrae]
MADKMVLRAQQWINTYAVSGIPNVEEDGRTSWAVMYALTRILQYELKITNLSDNFGPITLSQLGSQYPLIDDTCRNAAIVRVAQAALYCKGYDGGEINGVFDSRTARGASTLKQNMGLSGVWPGGSLTPKAMKALLTMDAYVRIGSGTEAVRSVQQWLNSRYIHRRNFFPVPCDGNFSRDVQRALMLAIQFELGMDDNVANGVFGPGTKAGLKSQVLAIGATGVWVQLFSAAMLFNQRPEVIFTDGFNTNLRDHVIGFQSFAALAPTGRADFQTWASLLVSTGDDSRAGRAFDCITTVTADRAKALFAHGYRIAGRYLCNGTSGTFNKMIEPGELTTITAAGMACFPIFQTWGGSPSYFSAEQGYADGLSAVTWARHHGFKAGTRIYFAVDFDALDHQVTNNILPHFEGISQALHTYGPEYKVGVYGPRNVCARVGAAGHSSASFVSGMSIGFSGNLGYPLPSDWAFDQIKTITIGTESSQIEIDNNITSGRDTGQQNFDPPQRDPKLYDVTFDMYFKNAMLRDLKIYMETVIQLGEYSFEFSLSTTDSYEIVLKHDRLVTELSKTLRIRKALIQAPLFWELRKRTKVDDATDLGVESYYRGQGGIDDCSTGLAQIYARTAIRATNYCTQNGIIAGTTLDPSNTAHVWMIWQILHNQDDKNVETVPLVLLHAAGMQGLGRPGLEASDDVTRQTLQRYNGTGDAAVKYGYELLGVYRVFEKYHRMLRER